MNRKNNPISWLKSAAGVASAAACLLLPQEACAEVTIAKGETWDAYVAGRVGVFASYAFGDGYPVPQLMGSKLQPGGGVDTNDPTLDTIYEYDAMGMKLPKQGKLRKLRVRSGYFPNILSLGARKAFGPELKLTAQVSVSGAIEPVYAGASGPPNPNRANGGRDNGVEAAFNEAFLRAEGSWGELTGGRFLSVFGRGMTELDVLYGHGYGVGFPILSRSQAVPTTGDLRYQGPTGGMSGFGVLSATYAAGVTYATPSLAGLKVTLGVFDPVAYPSAGWTRTSAPRPEAEIAYDLKSDVVTLHLFGAGGFQVLPNPVEDGSTWGVSGGGRFELGPVRIGGAGFMGKAPGIVYAFDDNESLSSGTSMRSTPITNPDGTPGMLVERSYELRTTRGFVGMVQVVLGPIDVGGGAGQTVVLQADVDKMNAATVSTLKSQTGIFAAAVYHANESVHLGVDFITGTYNWYNGESQRLNMLNGGVTVTF
ncbi:MAG TPA: hypothetical protein VJN18_22485 [Polyangiaceae bacterium]|nr:hypothetical protein [Polyangiaceae bacterium]